MCTLSDVSSFWNVVVPSAHMQLDRSDHILIQQQLFTVYATVYVYKYGAHCMHVTDECTAHVSYNYVLYVSYVAVYCMGTILLHSHPWNRAYSWKPGLPGYEAQVCVRKGRGEGAHITCNGFSQQPTLHEPASALRKVTQNWLTLFQSKHPLYSQPVAPHPNLCIHITVV